MEVVEGDGADVMMGGGVMIMVLKVGGAEFRKEGTVVGAEEVEMVRGGGVVIEGEVWNIMVKGGGAEVGTGMTIRRKMTVMYIGKAGVGIVKITEKVVIVEMVGGEGAEVVRGGGVMIMVLKVGGAEIRKEAQWRL